MKQLLLMRHGKSDWDAEYGRDHERPLNGRGARSARLVGRLLTGTGLTPDLVISSTAVRARTTAQLAAQAGGWVSPIRLDRRLYEEGPDGVISVAADSPDVARLMLVGHQPTWGLLVSTLTGEKAEMKTASVAVIELSLDRWSDLGDSAGDLVALHHPKGHFGGRWDEG